MAAMTKTSSAGRSDHENHRNERNKLLIVGLDGGTWNYLNPLLDQGDLPTLSGLVNSGVSGVLESTMPPITPTAWGSIVTGKNPGKHGVFNFLTWDASRAVFAPTASTQRSGKPFWRYLNSSGLRVGLVNVPFTYPIEPIDGFVVAGFGAPTSAGDLVFPAEARAGIEARFGKIKPAIDPREVEDGSLEGLLAAERELQAHQVEIALNMAKEFDVHVLVINLMLLDHANHWMPSMELVNQAIRYCDSDINKLITGFEPETVMLLSDHGSRRPKGTLLLANWLHDQGYLSYKTRAPQERADAINWVLAHWFQSRLRWKGLPERLVRRIALRAIAWMPRFLAGRFWRQVEASMPGAAHFVENSDQVDAGRSIVYPGSVFSGLLYLGGESVATPAMESVDQEPSYLTDVACQLEGLQDPHSKQSIFSHVHLGKDIYRGQAERMTPALVLDFYDSDWNVSTRAYDFSQSSDRNGYFASGDGEFGSHHPDGMYIFSGPNFKKVQKTARQSILDVATTIHYLTGVAIPSDYDGQVMMDLLPSETLERLNVSHQEPDNKITSSEGRVYTDDETQEIESQLRALGYIE